MGSEMCIRDRIITSLLAVIAAVFAIAPAAQAQSVQTVQIKQMNGYASSANNDGTVGFAIDNNNDFRQRFLKEKVSSNVFRFSRAGLNVCIRDAFAANDGGTMKLGSCSGVQAQWRESSFNGGKLYQNPASGHYLVAGFCFGLCPDAMDVLPKSYLDPWGGLDIARWQLDVI